MERLTVTEATKRANLFLEANTLVFIRHFDSRGRSWNYNGYIKKVTTDFILVYDLKLERDIPIPIDFIELIDPSTIKLRGAGDEEKY